MKRLLYFLLSVWLALQFLLLPCFSQDVQRQDYRERIQNLSQLMHETLDESNLQSKLLMEQLAIVENDSKLSEERVKELETQVRDLTSSSENTNRRLSEYSTKLTVSERDCKRWMKAAIAGWGILISLIAAFIIKKLGFLAKFL